MDFTYFIITPLFAYLMNKKISERSIAVKEKNNQSVVFYNVMIASMVVVFIGILLVIRFVR